MQSMKSRFASFVSSALARSNGIGILGTRVSTYNLTTVWGMTRFGMESRVNGGILFSIKALAQRLISLVAMSFTGSCFRKTECFEGQRNSNDGNRSLGGLCGPRG